MTSPDDLASTFDITVQPSGRVFTAQTGEAILSAGIRQGVGLPYGCRDGACGSCKCQLIEGRVIHGPHQVKALSETEEASGLILTCCAVAQTDVVLQSRQVTQVGALPVKRMPTRVITLDRKSPDVMVLTLQLPASEAFAYRAGQYIEFILRDGTRRSYSMANAPSASGGTSDTLELHIRHMPGGRFTDHVFSAMQEREILRAEGPFGSFYLRQDSAKPMVLLASGTGFAPIKALIEQMQQQAITRLATLYWGGRRPRDLYLHEWVQARAAEMPNLRYVPVVSDALPEDGWDGRTGFVHQAVLQDFPNLAGHQVYACGAPIVVDSARAAYIGQAGLAEEEFFADAFTSEADKAVAAG